MSRKQRQKQPKKIGLLGGTHIRRFPRQQNWRTQAARRRGNERELWLALTEIDDLFVAENKKKKYHDR